MESLRQQWKHLYAEHLPALAKARDPNQKHWPVHLDHCFARIILDNAVGKSRPWNRAIPSPAINHMSQAQFGDAVALAEAIATGAEDLDALNKRSLELRGKSSQKRKRTGADQEQATGEKKLRRSESGAISSYFRPAPQSPPTHPAPATAATPSPPTDSSDPDDNSPDPDPAVQLKRIAASSLTPFRKLMLGLLCQIPRGGHSTYQAMADFVGATSHRTCARAVGSAMRNNPFAPAVPCHRVLAADGSLGGFAGDWGEGGRFAGEKHRLLREEGVRFDSKGRVKGPVFREFRVL